MAGLRGKLDEATIASVQPSSQPQKLFDGGGLYLFVGLSGCCSWRLKYRYGGHEQLLIFGRYPLVSLHEARELRAVAKAKLRNGFNPIAIKRSSATKARWRSRQKMAENQEIAIPQI
jgi:hypothetical protein